MQSGANKTQKNQDMAGVYLIWALIATAIAIFLMYQYGVSPLGRGF